MNELISYSNHNHRERDQHPVSDCSIQHQIFCHCSNSQFPTTPYEIKAAYNSKIYFFKVKCLYYLALPIEFEELTVPHYLIRFRGFPKQNRDASRSHGEKSVQKALQMEDSRMVQGEFRKLKTSERTLISRWRNKLNTNNTLRLLLKKKTQCQWHAAFLYDALIKKYGQGRKLTEIFFCKIKIVSLFLRTNFYIPL